MFGNSKREKDLSDALNAEAKINVNLSQEIYRLNHKITAMKIDFKNRLQASRENYRAAQNEQFRDWRSRFDRTKNQLEEARNLLTQALHANEEFAVAALKAHTEILELKADISEQVRINRQYAEAIGEERRVNDNLRAQLKMHINSIYGKSSPDPEPSRIMEGLEETISKRDKTIKRLKAKVNKLASDNKAMAAEVLHNRNSM